MAQPSRRLQKPQLESDIAPGEARRLLGHQMIRAAAGVAEKFSTSGGRKAVSSKAFGILDPEESLHPSVKLCLTPRKVFTWNEFSAQKQKHSPRANSGAACLRL